MPALKAVQPTDTTEPTPLELLQQFQHEQTRLQGELSALQDTRDLGKLDAVAGLSFRLAHVEKMLPTLEEEAQQYERDTRLAAARDRVQPLWATQAKRKAEARATLASACRDIVGAIEEFRLSHENQLHLLGQVGVRQGAYGGLVSQLIQCMHAAISLTGNHAEWQGKLATFDPPGCSATLPSQEIM